MYTQLLCSECWWVADIFVPLSSNSLRGERENKQADTSKAPNTNNKLFFPYSLKHYQKCLPSNHLAQIQNLCVSISHLKHSNKLECSALFHSSCFTRAQTREKSCFLVPPSMSANFCQKQEKFTSPLATQKNPNKTERVRPSVTV